MHICSMKKLVSSCKYWLINSYLFTVCSLSMYYVQNSMWGCEKYKMNTTYSLISGALILFQYLLISPFEASRELKDEFAICCEEQKPSSCTQWWIVEIINQKLKEKRSNVPGMDVLAVAGSLLFGWDLSRWVVAEGRDRVSSSAGPCPCLAL